MLPLIAKEVAALSRPASSEKRRKRILWPYFVDYLALLMGVVLGYSVCPACGSSGDHALRLTARDCALDVIFLPSALPLEFF